MRGVPAAEAGGAAEHVLLVNLSRGVLLVQGWILSLSTWKYPGLHWSQFSPWTCSLHWQDPDCCTHSPVLPTLRRVLLSTQHCAVTEQHAPARLQTRAPPTRGEVPALLLTRVAPQPRHARPTRALRSRRSAEVNITQLKVTWPVRSSHCAASAPSSWQVQGAHCWRPRLSGAGRR